MFFWLVLFRCLHFAAALLAFAVPLFDAWVAGPGDRQASGLLAAARWLLAGRLMAAVYPALLLSGFGWFVLSAAQMTGTPLGDLFASGKAQLAWRATHFGFVCQVRLAIWCAGAATTAAWLALSPRLFGNRWCACAVLMLNAALLASLAWLGHAGTEGPLTLRVGIDALHLLIAGLWPAGLLPLTWLLFRLRHASTPAGLRAIKFLVARYSNLSLLAVTLLAATGIAQICFIPHPTRLIGTPYGILLAIKIVLFGLLVGVGAFNRFLLKPRIIGGKASVLAMLFWTLAAELLLAAAIIGVVAALGLMAPGNAA